MKNKNLYIIMCLMAIITIYQILLSKSGVYALCSCIGYGMMLAVSYVRCENVLEKLGIGKLFFQDKKHFTRIFLAAQLGALGGFVLFCVYAYQKEYEMVLALFDRSRDSAYIYNVMNWLLSDSKIFGRRFPESEIIAYLPECRTSCIFTYYIASYGVLAGVIIGILLLVLFAKIFVDMKKANLTGYILGMVSVSILFYSFVGNVLVNLRLLPFSSRRTFLPFFSQNIGSMLFCYLLMGVVLSVYRYALSKESVEC